MIYIEVIGSTHHFPEARAAAGLASQTEIINTRNRKKDTTDAGPSTRHRLPQRSLASAGASLPPVVQPPLQQGHYQQAPQEQRRVLPRPTLQVQLVQRREKVRVHDCGCGDARGCELWPP